MYAYYFKKVELAFVFCSVLYKSSSNAPIVFGLCGEFFDRKDINESVISSIFWARNTRCQKVS